jgi:uncharacterized protein YfeS
MGENGEEHDPFNEPKHRSKRSRELMTEDFFWNCVDCECPFGSEDGREAYYSYLEWRNEYPRSKISVYMNEIMYGQSKGYNESLTTDDAIAQSLKTPKKAFLANEYDPDALDVTVIAICLGQLIDEGKIASSIKKFGEIAIKRQSHKLRKPSPYRLEILEACSRVFQNA